MLCITFGSTATVKAADSSGLGEKVIEGGMRDLQWPVASSNIISSCFLDLQGHSHRHNAIDICGAHKCDVTAAYDGTVVEVVNSCRDDCPIGKGKSSGTGFGNYVVLEHSYTLLDGEVITIYTKYSHLSSAAVKEGDRVSAGDKIGSLGSTGCSYGYHLDFQVCYGDWNDYQNTSVDPFVNQLLEMPEGFTASGGASTSCCFGYVDAVKEIYSEALPMVEEEAMTDEEAQALRQTQIEEQMQAQVLEQMKGQEQMQTLVPEQMQGQDQTQAQVPEQTKGQEQIKDEE